MRALLRALVSTLTVAIFAILFLSLRAGRWDPDASIDLLIRNWFLFPAVFVFVLIWDYWFKRQRKGSG